MGDPTAAARAVKRERNRLLRGLREPNPAFARTVALPSVMASPPTVTVGAQSGTTQISGSTLVSWTDARLRYLGGTPVVAGVTFPDSTVCKYNQITSSVNPALMSVEFCHDGSAFEFLTKALASQKYRLIVDGQPATASQQLLGGVTGSLYLTKVDFGSRANRRIRLDGAIMYFGGIRIGPTDALRRVHAPQGPRVMGLGDSYLEGTGANMPQTGWFSTMCRLLGWIDDWNSGVGGTGFLNNGGGGGKVTYRSRVVADVIAYAPDVLFVAGGINDYVGFTAAQIQTEVALLIAQIRAALPFCVIVVTGPWDNSGNVPTANFVQTRDAIRTASLASGADVFLDTIGGPIPWSGNTNNYVNQGLLTGTGRVGAETGVGNADLYVGSDAVHPTQLGHDNIAYSMAAEFGAWVAAGAAIGKSVSPVGVVS